MDDRLLTETFVSKETIYNGRIFRVEGWQVRLPDGELAPRDLVFTGGASAVVPIDEAGCVMLVRQYRVAVGRITREIPAGKLDSPDEDPLAAAKRELAEETGLRASSWRKLTVLETTPGFCGERIHLYLATGLAQGDTHPDEDEFVAVERLPLDEAVQLVLAGELRDGKTALGLMMAAALTASDHING